jgi:glutamate---cysteine ligase / carboxylate-amine ligase
MDPREQFRRNDWPTLGVEVELQLVDAGSMALRSAIADLLEELPGELHDWVKPEFSQCYVEINTGVCRTVADVGADLDRKIRAVEGAADRCGVGLLWAATHPFSRWRDQEITPNERYYKLADLLGETVVRPVTFGLHVHVGVDTGDKAIRVCDGLQRHLPLLLALSANSPFWHGRPTGHHAHRVELLEGFPTGGLPPRMQSWDEYLRLFGQLKAAGFIESPKELWWDVRPSPEHGTVEVRICDMPPDLPSVLGLTALIQCLVADLSERIARSTTEPDCHPLMVRQNRWRAGRYGPEAVLVDPLTLEAAPARQVAAQLVGRLRPIAERLDCVGHLDHLLDMASGPSGSERQLALYEQTGDLAEVVRRLVKASRLTQGADPAIIQAQGRLGGVVDGEWPRAPHRFPAHTEIPAA